MSGNDFDTVPQCFQIPATETPGFFAVRSDQTFVQASPLAFDASVFEIWGALLNGAELVILPAGLRSPETIAAAVAEQGVTTLFLASCLFNLMFNQRPWILDQPDDDAMRDNDTFRLTVFWTALI
jgi:non-ribosomal peptide synthetase component F